MRVTGTTSHAAQGFVTAHFLRYPRAESSHAQVGDIHVWASHLTFKKLGLLAYKVGMISTPL